jgi:hypothetical protein
MANVVELASSRWHARGQEFESPYLHKFSPYFIRLFTFFDILIRLSRPLLQQFPTSESTFGSETVRDRSPASVRVPLKKVARTLWIRVLSLLLLRCLNTHSRPLDLAPRQDRELPNF